jgi:hypothetical protein
MKKVTYVVLFEVSKTDRREHAERIENIELNIFHESGCEFGAREPLSKALAEELDLTNTEGLTPMSLNDFATAFNDQEIDADNYWFSYVQVTIETQNDKDEEDKEFKDFVSELDAQCLQWGYPMMTDEQKVEAYEVYLDMQEQDPNGSHVWIEDALYSQYDSDDKMNIIKFMSGHYRTRTFLVQLPEMDEEQEITIAVDSLHTALENTDNLEGDIDDQIYFYVDDDKIHLRPEEICSKHLDEPIKFIEEIK